jgi:hypothetical protein
MEKPSVQIRQPTLKEAAEEATAYSRKDVFFGVQTN